MLKQFLIGDILKKVETKKVSLKKSDCSSVYTNEYNLPARTATTQNQGLSCFVPKDMATVLINKISVSANGDFCAFWHDTNFTILQDSYALDGNGFELNEKKALYIIASMYKTLEKKYNWNNKSGWEKIKKEKLYLPIKIDEKNNPIIDSTCFYHEEGFIPDFEHMEKYINELEKERMNELEKYLTASGLNDYELTEEEHELLSLKINYYNFKVEEIFNVEGTRSLDAGTLTFIDEGINFIGRTNENNGIQGKIEKQIFEPNKSNTITATVIGNYKYVKYQKEPYYCSQNINKLTPIFKHEMSESIALYFVSIIQKYVSTYNGQQGGYKLDDLKKHVLTLPVKDNNKNINSIDFEYMEKYIKAQEKLVIKNVVLFKDKVIEETKNIVFKKDKDN